MNNKQCGICVNCVPQINGGSGFNNCDEAHAAQLAEDNAQQFTKEQLIEQARKNIEVLTGAVTRFPGNSEAAKIHLHLAKITLAALTAPDDLLAAKLRVVELETAIRTHSESTHFCEVCGKDDPCATDDVCSVLHEPCVVCGVVSERPNGEHYCRGYK